MSSETLKRYTELPFVLQTLQTRSLMLLNPGSWDDKNDAHYVNLYRREKKLKTILAVCLTKAAQTYHHWKVFTHGASGACIHFHKDAIVQWVSQSQELKGKEVIYKTMGQFKQDQISLDDLPYIKRDAYRHEEEFRILYENKSSKEKIKNFPFSLDMIEKVVINPWLPDETTNTLKVIINGISGCNSIPVLPATIVSSEKWKQLGKNVVDFNSI